MRRRPLRSYLPPSLSSLLLALAACGGSTAGGPPPGGPPPGAEATPLDAARSARVYDATGKEQACAPPEGTCPPVAPDREFSDSCALAGYRIVQCGCDARCTGDVSAAAKGYHDAQGAQKTCEPAKPDCSPEPAPAAFQDACTEKGYRLEICGCEWLCSGNFSK